MSKMLKKKAAQSLIAKPKIEKISLKAKFDSNFPIDKLYDIEDIKENIDTINIGGDEYGIFSRTLEIDQFPSNINYNELNRILAVPSDCKYTIKFYIKPANRIILDKKITFARSFYSAMSYVKGMFLKRSEIELSKQVSDLNNFEYELYQNEDAVNLTMIITLFADTKDRLDKVEKKIQGNFQLYKWKFSKSLFNQKRNFILGLPRSISEKNVPRQTLLSKQVSHLLLSTNDPEADAKSMSSSILLGVENTDNTPYMFPYFKNDRVYNITITGKNGSGKSSLMKKFFEELNIFSIQRILIDPEGEYSDVSNYIGANIIKLNRSKGINPFYYNKDALSTLSVEEGFVSNLVGDHILLLEVFFKQFTFIPEKYKQDTSMLIASLEGYYKSCEGVLQSITDGEELSRHGHDVVPNMIGYCNYLMGNKEKYEFAEVMQNFMPGKPYSGYFTSLEPFELKNEAIVFNLKDIEHAETKLAMMYMIIAQIKDKMLANNAAHTQGSSNKVITTMVDEFHLFLRDKSIRESFIEIAKRNRKYNCNFILATQEIHDFEKYDAVSLIEQSGYNFVFRQDERCQTLLKLKDNQINYITRLKVGSCFVVDPSFNENNLESKRIFLYPHQIKYSAKINTVF